MSDNKSRDIFYGVVAIATLIVALVGATLAYFSISTSSKEGAVNAKGATVSVQYLDGQQVSAQADELIPATLDVVKKVYAMRKDSFSEDGNFAENEKTKCIDTKGKQVCSIYRFSVSSDVEREITATLNNELNTFTYLSYGLYDVSGTYTCSSEEYASFEGDTNEVKEANCIEEKRWQVIGKQNAKSLNLNLCTNEDEDESNNCYSINESTRVKTYNTNPMAVNSIFGLTADNKLSTKTITNTAQVYDLVIFIKENNDDQNIDQGKQYKGTIIVKANVEGESGIITGRVD